MTLNFVLVLSGFLWKSWSVVVGQTVGGGEECGSAPLCGTPSGTFNFVLPDVGTQEDFADRNGNLTLVGESVAEFPPCCTLRDTIPSEGCQTVNLDKPAKRYLELEGTLDSYLESFGESGDSCADNSVVMVPYIFSGGSDMSECCRSCSCYGDPVCTSFSGKQETWVLCDGREVNDDGKRYCRITEDQCSKQLDHSGRQCAYLADHPLGKDWSVPRKGSPCVPNPESPPSTILMYSVWDYFAFTVTQGERGVIKRVRIDLEHVNASFALPVNRCLKKGEDAWLRSGSGVGNVTNLKMTYSTFGKSGDVLWSITDVFTQVSISLRCFGNTLPGSTKRFVPRINIESLNDPIYFRPEASTSGFCFTGELDTGLATTNNTNFIEADGLCEAGLQNFTRIQHFRMVCQNPTLPQSGIEDCIHQVCDKHYSPHFNTSDLCAQTMNTKLDLGFCMTFTESVAKKEECLLEWAEFGPESTIEEFMAEATEQESSIELAGSEAECDSGVFIQIYDQNTSSWVDYLFFSDGSGALIEEKVLSRCDHPDLFSSKMRIEQRSADKRCNPSKQCGSTSGISLAFGVSGKTVSPTASPTESPTAFPSLTPTEQPTSDPTSSPTEQPVLAPTPNVEEENPDPPNVTVCSAKLCDSPVSFESLQAGDANNSFSSSVDFDSCCPGSHEDVCPQVSNATIILERFSGINQSFCGRFTASPIHEACLNRYELDLSIGFEDNTLESCCKTCTCYGDPRCISFDGTFEEFVLCDARTRPKRDSSSGRCVIRKDTCEEQVDHAGNQCVWGGEGTKDVPNFASPAAQNAAEDKYSILKNGSPCRYDLDASPPALVKLYETIDGAFSITAEQYERGYIRKTDVIIAGSKYTLEVESCLKSSGWNGAAPPKAKFATHGHEILWEVYDSETGIELGLRCTGTYFQSGFSSKFINIEYLNEPNETRAAMSEGFCSSGVIEESLLASTDHTKNLSDTGACDAWNNRTTKTVLRNVARIITGQPGVTAYGVGRAYNEFCEKYYDPLFASVAQCVESFVRSNHLAEIVTSFCEAVNIKRSLVKICEEDVHVMLDESSYETAFALAREKYLTSYQETCFFDDLNAFPKAIDSASCEAGVELQYSPVLNSDIWVTYAAFPALAPPCKGYNVKLRYSDDHKPLFQYPLRFIQRRYPDSCSGCDSVPGISAVLTFSDPLLE